MDVLRHKLQSATHVFITYGTAWGYKHLEKDQIVANCHKLPQKNFAKELYSVEEVTQTTLEIVTLLKDLNPSAEVSFTVSPVRHLKDGVVQNTLSKAHLIAGIHQAREKEPRIGYLPAYEIMMDELRDYRFYQDDMIHPNLTAIDYIFERFKEACIAPLAYKTMSKVLDIQKGLAHRPFNENSEANQRFLAQLNEKISTLQKEVPQISF
ncbi:hypothetical protein GCM10009117_05450 [Gangjinia marincola]|uniref:GSCFA domain-containing protein n=1 Tax=Gangjinia marincola TaxID=578463 RepID=A0ABP3XQ76_9FLAO